MTFSPQMQITAPKVTLVVSVQVGQFDELPGLQYVLLRMIDYVHESGRDMNLSNVMDEFGMPHDLISLLELVLNDLEERSMISVSQEVTEYLSLRDVELTEAGKSLYKEGYIMVGGSTVEEKVIFYPAQSHKYKKPKNLKIVKSERKYQFDIPNENSLSNEIRKKWDKDKETNHASFKGIIAEISEIEHYQITLFPKLIGYDTIDVVDASDIDEKFLFTNYSGEDIFNEMEKLWNLENLPLVHNGLFGNEPSGDYSLILPCSLEYRSSQLFLYNSDRISAQVDKTNVRSSELPYDADLIIIMRKDLAFAYWFVKRSIRIKGFSTKKEVVLLAFNKLNNDLIPILSTELEYSQLPGEYRQPIGEDDASEEPEETESQELVEIPSDLYETKSSADRGNEEDQFRMAKYLLSVGRVPETRLGYYYLVWSAFHKQDLFDYFVKYIDEHTYPYIAKAAEDLADRGYIIKNSDKSIELFKKASIYRKNNKIEDAKFFALRSALMGNMMAFNLMALIAMKDGSQSDSTVLNLIKVSALLGYPNALINLGLHYEKGDLGLEVNYALAEEYYLAAKEAGAKIADTYLRDLKSGRK